MGNPENQLEIEVKFYLPDTHGVRDKISGAGTQRKAPVFETNVRYDTGEKKLTRSNSLLRLRKDTRVHLTYKSPPANSTHCDGEYKIFKELEVEVSDFDTMNALLAAMGYHREQVYEKWRETFFWNHCLLCFDTMPFGDFLEIEGDKTRIKETAKLLELDWSKRICTNYLSIFETLKAKCGWTFSDLTFRNFQAMDFDFSRYSSFFESTAG